MCLFSDLRGGRSEPVYLANMLLVDTVLSPSEIAAFGGPSAGGIALVGSSCPADFNGDTILDFFDVLAFLQAFTAGEPEGDFNNDTIHDFFDVLAFLAAFTAGCP